MRNGFRLALLTAALVGPAAGAFAATDAVNAASVSPTLQVSATVQKAISLTLSTGPSGTTCTVNSGSDFSISFGNVDALGINAGCGSKFAPATPGSTAAAYFTDYRVTPVFANQAGTSANVTAYVSTNFSTLSSILSVVQSTVVPGSIAGLSA